MQVSLNCGKSILIIYEVNITWKLKIYQKWPNPPKKLTDSKQCLADPAN